MIIKDTALWPMKNTEILPRSKHSKVLLVQQHETQNNILLHLLTKAMLVWLHTHICNWLAIFLCLVVTFQPRFHSDYLAPSATAFVKKVNHSTNVSTELPASPYMCSQARRYEINYIDRR